MAVRVCGCDGGDARGEKGIEYWLVKVLFGLEAAIVYGGCNRIVLSPSR